MKKIRLLKILFFGMVALPAVGLSQPIQGRVVEEQEAKKLVPLEQAAVYLLKARKGIMTNEEGKFELPSSPGDTLIAIFAGYKPDTIPVDGRSFYEIILAPGFSMDTVRITRRLLPTWVDMLSPMQTEIITEDELGKSACCNLSESFSTNGSVEVNESDAVTGSKEIRMLGLAGRYSQVMTERRSTVRGLGFLFGLNWIPGTWIQSIQISKGAGSVTDGYESMTGEINVELKKPETAEKFLLNLYGNQFGRGEINLVSGQQLGKRWSTAFLGHASLNQLKFDSNNDGFLNFPKTRLVMGMNRWKWEGPNNACIQFGVKGLYEDRLGGEMDFNPETDRGTTNHYGFGMVTRRIESFAKLGFVAKQSPWRTLGSIFNYFYHDQEAYFGLTDYNANQSYFKGSILYNDIIGDTRHKYFVGINYISDHISEQVSDTLISRKEHVAGAFAEYAYHYLEKLTLVTGLRGDYNNLFGFALTPRFQLRWSPKENTTVRASAGYGYRTPNVIAENIQVLLSSRQFIFSEQLKQEKAWTFGANIVQKFKWFTREGSFSLDIYRTFFLNQLITDLETPGQVKFYNLNGQSFSNVGQAEVNVEVLPRFDVKVAFRFQDVRATIDDSLQQIPLNPKYRGLINLAYKNKSGKWQFDFTTQYTGVQRIPDTRENPSQYRQNAFSKGFFTFNSQITRKFKRIELYLGAENIGNFMQMHPIIAHEDPFGPYFDASLVWGPLMGRQIYGGLRYSIKK